MTNEMWEMKANVIRKLCIYKGRINGKTRPLSFLINNYKWSIEELQNLNAILK